MPAARTDTSGGSNTLAINPGQRGASAGVVAILAGDSGLAGLARADSGLAGTMRADSGLAGLLCGHFVTRFGSGGSYGGMVLLLCNSHGERRATQF